MELECLTYSVVCKATVVTGNTTKIYHWSHYSRFLTFLRKFICSNILPRSKNLPNYRPQLFISNKIENTNFGLFACFQNFTCITNSSIQTKNCMVFYGVNIISQRVLYAVLLEHRNIVSHRVLPHFIVFYTIQKITELNKNIPFTYSSMTLTTH